MKVRFLAVGLPGNRPILATALALKFDIQQATINQPARQVLNGTAGPLIWLFDVIDMAIQLASEVCRHHPLKETGARKTSSSEIENGCPRVGSAPVFTSLKGKRYEHCVIG